MPGEDEGLRVSLPPFLFQRDEISSRIELESSEQHQTQSEVGGHQAQLENPSETGNPDSGRITGPVTGGLTSLPVLEHMTGAVGRASSPITAELAAARLSTMDSGGRAHWDLPVAVCQ